MMILLSRLIEHTARNKHLAQQSDALANFMIAVPVDINNVARWLFETYPEGVRIGDCKLLLNPPFDLFWMEYEYQQRRIGFLIQAEADSPDRFFACGFADNPDEMLGFLLTTIDENGPNLGWYPAFDDQEPSEELREKLFAAFTPCLFAITFFHCRNIEIVEVPSLLPRADRRRLQARGITPPPTVRQILVHAGRKLVYDLPKPMICGNGKRSHVVRGHFKHFGEKFGTHKLFGRLDGTYFWHPHFAGLGAPANRAEYTVLEPRHGKCIIN